MMKPNGIDSDCLSTNNTSLECGSTTQPNPSPEASSKGQNVPNIGMIQLKAGSDLDLGKVDREKVNINKLVVKSNAVIELPGGISRSTVYELPGGINRKYGIVKANESHNLKNSHSKFKAEDVGLRPNSIHLVVPSTSAIVQQPPESTHSSRGIVSSSSNNLNVTVSVSSAKYSQIIPTSQVTAILPTNSTLLSSSSANQTGNITAFVAPLQNSPKSVPSSSTFTSLQQPVIQSAACGAKILISSPPLVNGQLRQNVLPVVCSASGTTIILAQGSSVLSVPKATTQTSPCVHTAQQNKDNSAASGATAFSSSRTSHPVGTTLSITDSLGQFLQRTDCSLSLAKPSLSTVTFSNLPHVLPISSSKRNWQGTTQSVNNRTILSTKQKTSLQLTPASSASTTSHRYYGLPYQDHNYGAPPPPTPPSSPPPSEPSPEDVETSLINVDEDTNTSSVSTETALSTNGDDIEDVAGNVTREGPIESARTPTSNNDEQGITRCICEFNHDDELMICCDQCLVWQHVDCMGLNRDSIPETYLCERCNPRKVDIKRAKSVQSKKRGKLRPVNYNSDTSSAEESRAENHPKIPIKKKKLKKRPSSKKVVKAFIPSRGNFKEDRTSRKAPNKLRLKDVKRENFKKRVLQKKKIVPLKSTPSVRKIRKDKKVNEEAKEYWDKADDWHDYEEALINQYTPEIQVQVSSLRLNGQNGELINQMPKSSWVNTLCQQKWSNAYGDHLISICDIEPNQIVIEYRGKFSLLSQFEEENSDSNKLYPYVLFYSPGDDNEDVCVDARKYGNFARFVRRSCTSNTRVQHVVENGLLHLYLCSTRKISKSHEITIPFDFNYRKCVNKVECACSKEKCPVATVIVKKNGLTNETPAISEKVVKVRKKSQRKKPVPLMLVAEKQNKTKNSPSSPLKTVRKPPVSPLKVSHVNNVGDSLPSENDNHGSNEDTENPVAVVDGKHKMTREERKMQYIVKMIAKMEEIEKKKAVKSNAKHNVEGDSEEKHTQSIIKEPSEQNNVFRTSLNSLENVPELSSTEVRLNGGPEEGSCEEKSKESSSQSVKVNQSNRVKKGKKKRTVLSASRKRLRTISGSSDQSALCSSADESACMTPGSNWSSTVSAPSTSEIEFAKDPSVANQHPFRFPKTKKMMMSEWLHDTCIQKEDIEVPSSPPPAYSPSHPLSQTPGFERSISLYSRMRESKTGISVAHLRRHSSCDKDRITLTESNMGSAKKRWLRQVQHDEEVVQCSSPTPVTALSVVTSPPCEITSGGNVTPLKKRRLMRGSMTCEMLSPGIQDGSTDSTTSPVQVEMKVTPSTEDSVITKIEKKSPDQSSEPFRESCKADSCEFKDEPISEVKPELSQLIPSDLKSSVEVDKLEPPDEKVEESLPTILELTPKSEKDTSEPMSIDLKPEVIEPCEDAENLNGTSEKLEPEMDCEFGTVPKDDVEVKVEKSEDAEPVAVVEMVFSNLKDEKVDVQQNSNEENSSGLREQNVGRIQAQTVSKVLFPEEPTIDTKEVHKEEKNTEVTSILTQAVSEISSAVNAPAKKKVSLVEYRMRKNLTVKPTTSTSTSPSHSKGSSANESSSNTPDSNSTSPINLNMSFLTPVKLDALPLFKNFEVDKKTGKTIKSGKFSAKSPSKEKTQNKSKFKRSKFTENESDWNSAPTTFEKIAEQQRENITQRLEREFGLSVQEPSTSSAGTSSHLSQLNEDANLVPPPPPKPPGGLLHAKTFQPGALPPPPPPPRPAKTVSSSVNTYNIPFAAGHVTFPPVYSSTNNMPPVAYAPNQPPLPATYVTNQPRGGFSLAVQKTEVVMPLSSMNYMPQSLTDPPPLMQYPASVSQQPPYPNNQDNSCKPPAKDYSYSEGYY